MRKDGQAVSYICDHQQRWLLWFWTWKGLFTRVWMFRDCLRWLLPDKAYIFFCMAWSLEVGSFRWGLRRGYVMTQFRAVVDNQGFKPKWHHYSQHPISSWPQVQTFTLHCVTHYLRHSPSSHPLMSFLWNIVWIPLERHIKLSWVLPGHFATRSKIFICASQTVWIFTVWIPLRLT